ncbi:hypothetical protein F4808DRAFT_458627 [Astrocystis sublimbata]|nr:hypothetical protein F4808DRAFT_458627 [Astrocystis sublimbata]
MLFPLLLALVLTIPNPVVFGIPEPILSLGPLLPSSPTGPLAPIISLLANLGNADPPPLLQTSHPSPQCAVSKGGNGGALQCCRIAVAGDQPVVVFLAGVYGYNLNPNDVNGLATTRSTHVLA